MWQFLSGVQEFPVSIQNINEMCHEKAIWFKIVYIINVLDIHIFRDTLASTLKSFQRQNETYKLTTNA